MEMILAIVFGAIGLLMLIWLFHSYKTPFSKKILKAVVIVATVWTLAWLFLSFAGGVTSVWSSFAAFAAIIGALFCVIVALLIYLTSKLAS